jgi:hypothetical protein
MIEMPAVRKTPLRSRSMIDSKMPTEYRIITGESAPPVKYIQRVKSRESIGIIISRSAAVILSETLLFKIRS